jgi:hypothetical protein
MFLKNFIGNVESVVSPFLIIISFLCFVDAGKHEFLFQEKERKQELCCESCVKVVLVCKRRKKRSKSILRLSKCPF